MSKVVKANYTAEAVAGFTHRTAMEEAARCLLCHDAPCSKGCPAGTDPAKFIRSIRFRNDRGAAETIRENNILGGTCQEYVLMTDCAKKLAADAESTNRSKSANCRDMLSSRKKLMA